MTTKKTGEAETSIPTLTLYRLAREDEPRWAWTLVAANGEKIARSSQGGGFRSARSAWSNFSLIAEMFKYFELSSPVPKIGSDRVYHHEGAPMLRVKRSG